MRNQPKYKFFANWGYALAGLAEIWRSERSFRLEIFVFAPLLVSLFFWNFGLVWNLALVFGAIFTLVIECINSSIERVVDLSHPDFHPLAGAAKDTASTAVMLTLSLNFALWVCAICGKIFG
ncbi:diacylglycerol kinase [Campylobacter sp. JMF_02 ED1]|uniref:diacylglycerol kinase n=1 Tax=Campylobacter sp. JMF_02 ED1 TaxID=2983826 RepID=UPI0022E9DEA4|nr:diacylglycerol kinase [Campylobacter sp. JMF_02 ED1]MDA3051669.1 diacylglycerol kinase [Campylobacter sp. JMF_02 ED1]